MTYLVAHWQPIAVFLIGIAILGIYYFLHFRKKQIIVPWIAKYMLRNQNMVPSAEGLFNVVTSFIFLVGGIWIIVAIFYLSNG
jgi:hypothetical protein